MPEEDSRSAEKAGIMIRRGDITRPETLEGLFDTVDIVFHLATRTSDWGAASAFEKIMVQGTGNILRACQKSAPRFLYFFHRLTNGVISRVVADLLVKWIIKKQNATQQL